MRSYQQKLLPMDQSIMMEGISLRPAKKGDAATIRRIISSVNINPLGLNWRRFILAVDQRDNVIGCGQIKPHSDGTYELASIAVLPEWRGKGIARMIIQHLLGQHPGRLYLTCRADLGELYQKFGFESIEEGEMTPYYRRIFRLMGVFSWIRRLPDRLLVMRRG
jgi:N-acetylglutamate synthase-like GNAT family acetyltransferase